MNKIDTRLLDIPTAMEKIAKEIGEASEHPEQVACFMLEDWAMELTFLAMSAKALLERKGK